LSVFSFIHCADLHLDSPLRGLSGLTETQVHELRSATRKALNNLVDLALLEKVNFVLIAGDVYDGDWDDYSTGLFFNRCMLQLRDAGIRVFLIRGNHDAQSQISRSLILPENVKELRTDKPESVILDDLQVAIHGQGFAQRAVTDNLAMHYPAPVPGYFNIGMLHTCAEGQEGHEPYAPCKVAELVHMGYQYWALGHIHKRQVLHSHPPVVFPGNIQGRHIREEGDKGCTLVKVDGTDVALEHRSLDVVRWCQCEVNLAGVSNSDEFLAAVQAELGQVAERYPSHQLAVRVVCKGMTPLHGAFVENTEYYRSEVLNGAQAVAYDRLWIEKVKFDTQPPATRPVGSHGAMKLESVIEDVMTDVRNHEDAQNLLNTFLRDMQHIQTNLRDYLQTPDAVKVDSEQDVEGLLKDARSLLVNILANGGLTA